MTTSLQTTECSLRRYGGNIFPLLFVLLSILTVRPAAGQTVQQTVTMVEDHYRGLSDLTASVVQKNVLKSLDKTQKFSGKLWIKKPGKLRLEYTNGQLIVIDGKAVLFYSKKSEEVIKKTFTDFEQMNIPVAFLLGAGHIRDDFDVLQPDPKQPGRLELIPKKPGAAMKKMDLESDRTGRISTLTIYDRSGNVSEIAFSDVRENAGVGDKLFQFKPPKGTEIIEQ